MIGRLQSLWLAVALPVVASCAVEDAGEPCGSDSDCEQNCFTNRLFSEEGLCTSRCGPDAITPCPSGWACVDTGSEDYWCLPECEGLFGSSCRERYGYDWECESLPLEEGGEDDVCID